MSDEAGHPSDLLPLAAAGTLDPDAQHAVDAHLPGCPRCAGELEEWRRIARATRAAESVDALPGRLTRRSPDRDSGQDRGERR